MDRLNQVNILGMAVSIVLCIVLGLEACQTQLVLKYLNLLQKRLQVEVVQEMLDNVAETPYIHQM